MTSPRSFLSACKSISSSDGFSSTNHSRSGSHTLLRHQQQRLQLEVQQRNIIMGKEHPRQLRSPESTFSIKPLVNVQNYYVNNAHRIPSMMPQPYAIDGREHKGVFAPIAKPTHVGEHAQPVTTHLAMPKHASNITTLVYNYQNRKRKCITTEVPTGSSTDVVLGSTPNAVFGFEKNYEGLKRKCIRTEVPTRSSTGVVLESIPNTVSGFDKNCQEVQMLIENKKNTSMALSLINENDVDDAAERAAREIQFFPLIGLCHVRPRNDSEFSMYEISSVLGDGCDVDLDLSLKHSSSSHRSSIIVDLSLKL